MHTQEEEESTCRKIVLRLSDLEPAKSAVLNGLSSPCSRRNYKFATETPRNVFENVGVPNRQNQVTENGFGGKLNNTLSCIRARPVFNIRSSLAATEFTYDNLATSIGRSPAKKSPNSGD